MTIDSKTLQEAQGDGPQKWPARCLVLLDQNAALEADNARLRALVAALKPPADGRGMWLGRCPWCHAAWSPTPGYRTFAEGNENEPHGADCPAFTPDGEVR